MQTKNIYKVVRNIQILLMYGIYRFYWSKQKFNFKVTQSRLSEWHKNRLKVAIKKFWGRYIDLLAYLVNLSHSLLMIYYTCFYRSWQNLEYDRILIMIQYCENSILASIMTFTNSDICKWLVALVRQEMLIRSGAPDFIRSPFG